MSRKLASSLFDFPKNYPYSEGINLDQGLKKYERLDKRQFVGTRDKNFYVIEKKLGEGTFGEVHRAYTIDDKRKVAIKRIILHNEDEGFPITSTREIKILKKMDHLNVLSLCDMIHVKGDKSTGERATVYMVMPYMDHDLSGLIENPAVEFTLPHIKCYLKQILEGTAYLHSKKILHRDIKPANILVNNEGILKLADFGLSRYTSDTGNALTNNVVTRWFRPPELLLGERYYSYSIDMWGVGCVFAQMLVSKAILRGNSDLEQLQLIFELCGSPNDQTMPGWQDYPNSNIFEFPPSSPSRIKERFYKQDPNAVALIEEFLNLNPAKRITAKQAIDHYFFSTLPLPDLPSNLPRYESSHELGTFASRAEPRRLPEDLPRNSPPPIVKVPHHGGYNHNRNERFNYRGRNHAPDNRNNRRNNRSISPRKPYNNHHDHHNARYANGKRDNRHF